MKIARIVYFCSMQINFYLTILNMPSDTKILSIIILVINLVVLGPVSWIIKDIKTNQANLQTILGGRMDAIEQAQNQARDFDYRYFVPSKDYAEDMQGLKKRISILENRIYELNARPHAASE